MISRKIFLTALLCFGSFAVSKSSFAQSAPVSSDEDVAIAFFKAGDTNPDFDLWAKSSKEYKVAAPVMAANVLYEEKQRLMEKWHAFDKNESLLTIEGVVNVDLKTVVGEGGEEQHWMYMSFSQGDVTYFPYEYLEYKFAVIPQQIETLMVQYLQKPQYELILSTFEGKVRGSGYLSMQLKASKSYMQQPYPIDGKEQWVLLCDIATMSLISGRTRKAMWNYGADWYVSPVTQGVMDLHSTPSESPAVPVSP